MAAFLNRVGGGGWIRVCRPAGGGNRRLPSLALVLLSLFLTAAARPARAGYGVEILQPTGGGHSGAALLVSVNITDTGNNGMVQVTRFRVVCGGDEVTNITDPGSFTFYPDPQNPGTLVCPQYTGWWAHSKTSPGTYQITATLEYTVTTMVPNGRYDEWGNPLMDPDVDTYTVEDTDSFTLDNYGPVSITRASPNGTVSGWVNIQAEVVPAPAAGAGGWMCGPEGGGDFMDRVEYTAGDFHQDLTHIQGGYWDPETQQYVEAPNRWIGSWNTAEQYDPQNDPTGVARWGDPKYPDGTYNQQVKAYFGPNVKIGGEGTLTLKNKGKIRGTVRDAEGGSISGATVVVARYWQDPNQEPVQYDPNMPPGEPMNTQIERIYATATTDAGGHYEVEVYPGSYSLSASHPDYVKGGAGAGVWPGATTEPVDFYLNRRVSWEVPWDPGMMMGPRLADGLYTMTVCVVVRDQSGQPLAGVPVTFTATGGTITTDPVNTAVGADGLARACVNLTAPQSSEDVTIQIGATVGGGEGGGATTPNPLPITFGGVVATATMQPMTKAGGGEIGQYVGGKVRGNVRVSSSDGVTLTGLRARIKENTTDHPAEWREIENVQDFTWAPPPGMGGRWGVTGSGQGYVDYWFEIDTVGLGLHNFEHTLEITASFSTSQALDPVTVTQNFTVRNLVVTNVQSNVGEDYFKYDPDEDAPAEERNPSFSFDIEDAADDGEYVWVMYMRPTPAPSWDATDWAWLRGTQSAPGTITASWNGKRDNNTSSDDEVEERGTYTYDIVIWEVDDAGQFIQDPNSGFLDRTAFKAHPYNGEQVYFLQIPDQYIGPDGAVAGHLFDTPYDEAADRFPARISYYLQDYFHKDAREVKVRLVDHLFASPVTYAGGAGDRTPYNNIDIHYFGDDSPGMWRAIFLAEDDHREYNRQHMYKRMLAVNDTLKDRTAYLAGEIASRMYFEDDGWEILWDPAKRPPEHPGPDSVLFKREGDVYRLKFVDNKMWGPKEGKPQLVPPDQLRGFLETFEVWKGYAQREINTFPPGPVRDGLVAALQQNRIEKVVTNCGGWGVRGLSSAVHGVTFVDAYVYSRERIRWNAALRAADNYFSGAVTMEAAARANGIAARVHSGLRAGGVVMVAAGSMHYIKVAQERFESNGGQADDAVAYALLVAAWDMQWSSLVYNACVYASRQIDRSVKGSAWWKQAQYWNNQN